MVLRGSEDGAHPGRRKNMLGRAVRIMDRAALVLLGAAIPLAVLLVYYVLAYHRVLVGGRWPLGAYEHDPVVGFRLARGFSAPLLDGSFHTRTHSLGYRIPQFGDPNEVIPGGILSLGCSFTYGDELEAEETFTYRAAAELGLPAYNYGVCAYSYATMLLLLQRLQEEGVIERLRPGFVLLAVGDWLVPRSFNPFMPSEGLQYAYPYLRERAGHLEIAQPPEQFSLAHMFCFQKAYFPEGRRDVPLTPRRFLLLVREVPRVLYANFLGNRERARLKREAPVPAQRVYDFLLQEVEKISAPAGMRVLVLWMATVPGQTLDPALRAAVARHPGVLLINGGEALRYDAVPPEEYCCGHHPGPKAHAAYARAIAERVRALYLRR